MLCLYRQNSHRSNVPTIVINTISKEENLYLPNAHKDKIILVKHPDDIRSS